jgi:hypothetical protein
MSIRVMSKVWEFFPRGGSELLTILALADWADDDGFCFPAVASVAKKTRVTRSAAQRSLHRLLNSGFVEVVGNANGGPPGNTRKYRVKLESLTGSVDATSSANATGSVDAQDGPRGRSMTGSVDATQTVIEPSVTVRGAKKPRAAKRTSKTACPERFEVTEPMTEWAQGKGLLGDRVMPETEKFLDHHRSKGTTFADWMAAWRNWIAKAVEYRGRA